jgi:hypothetical protein
MARTDRALAALADGQLRRHLPCTSPISMLARLDDEGDLLSADDRPTLPAPAAPAARESGVRLQMARIACAGATVDVVVCDLSRDPRSEEFTVEVRPPPRLAMLPPPFPPRRAAR